jgi:arylsulfatase
VNGEGTEGVIVSNGGAEGGYSLCMLGGRLHYVCYFLGRALSVLATTQIVSPGRHTVRLEFERTGQHAGRASLLVNGTMAGEIDIPRTNPLVYAVAEGLEIGSDSTSAVWPAYRSPFRFTGEIDRVTITVHQDDPPPTAEESVARHRTDMLNQ